MKASGKLAASPVQRIDNLFIYERDRGMCLRCGNINCDPPHHIVFKSEYGALQDGQWNRILLCRRCHRWAHGETSGPLREGMSDKRARQRELLQLLADCHGAQNDLEWQELWKSVGGDSV